MDEANRPSSLRTEPPWKGSNDRHSRGSCPLLGQCLRPSYAPDRVYVRVRRRSRGLVLRRVRGAGRDFGHDASLSSPHSNISILATYKPGRRTENGLATSTLTPRPTATAHSY